MRLGDVLSGYTQAGGVGLEAVSIGYVRDAVARSRINAGELDAASIEADLILAWDSQKEIYVVESVDCVDAVALASSKDNAAGFERAGIVAVVNELMEGGSRMDADDKRTPEQIANDPFVKMIIDKAVADAVAIAVAPLKAQVLTLTAEKGTIGEQLTAAVKKLQDSGSAANAPIISKILNESVNTLKLEKPVKDGILEDLGKRLKVDDPAATSEQIKKIVEDAVVDEAARIESYAKRFGKPASSGGDFRQDQSKASDDGELSPFEQDNLPVAKVA